MNFLLAAVCFMLFSALLVSLFFNLKHANIILDVEDALEDALKVCDESYGKMTDILDMPVALNTPEVRQVITQIRAVKDSILYVTNVLAAPYNGIVEDVGKDIDED